MANNAENERRIKKLIVRRPVGLGGRFRRGIGLLRIQIQESFYLPEQKTDEGEGDGGQDEAHSQVEQVARGNEPQRVKKQTDASQRNEKRGPARGLGFLGDEFPIKKPDGRPNRKRDKCADGNMERKSTGAGTKGGGGRGCATETERGRERRNFEKDARASGFGFRQGVGLQGIGGIHN